jgi:ribosomal protein S21
MINVEVQRHGNENVAGLLRRFSRKMQSSGVVRRVRGLRYHSRTPSASQQKKDALTRIKRTEHYVELYKQGREIPSRKKRR